MPPSQLPLIEELEFWTNAAVKGGMQGGRSAKNTVTISTELYEKVVLDLNISNGSCISMRSTRITVRRGSMPILDHLDCLGMSSDT